MVSNMRIDDLDIKRFLVSTTLERMVDEPAVLVNGPRSVGKSALMKVIADSLGATVIDLDDLPTRQAVAADPTFYTRGQSPVIFDEFQHVPQLLDAIKAEL